MTDETTPTVPAVPDPPRELVDVRTGQFLPATPENAAHVILVAREMKQRITEVVRDAEAYLADLSRVQGTKTFHTDFGKIELAGGESVQYDPYALAVALRAAGCPEQRIEEVVVATVSHSVDRRVLRQLVAANPDYAAAAESASQKVETPLRASVKTPTGGRRT